MSNEEFSDISARLDRIEQCIERLALTKAKPILDIREAADYTGFSVKHLYRLTASNQIPHYKKNNKLLFKKTELEHWLTEHKVPTVTEINQRATTYTATHKL